MISLTIALNLFSSLFAGEPHSGDFSDRVTKHYVEMAHGRYRGSLKVSGDLLDSINEFLKQPTEKNQQAAKQRWLMAHRQYSETEVFRFGNPNVDEWESKVNAWPMDEGLIDYVAEGYVYHQGNDFATANIIGKGKMPITDELLAKYQSGAEEKEAPSSRVSEIETNVTLGFHAVEFLLWGQDLNRNPGDSGKRPHTDYVLGPKGSNRSTKRRRAYLSAVSRRLIQDFRFMINDWDPIKGRYAKTFLKLPVEDRLDRMIIGLGSLSFAELASERLRVPLLASDQEEEQSCFSDTTHFAILHNTKGIEATYLGRFTDEKGQVIEGPSLSALVQKVDLELDKKLRKQLQKSVQIAAEIVKVAEKGEHFDQMIQIDNPRGRKRIAELMDALKSQTESFEKLRSLKSELAKH